MTLNLWHLGVFISVYLFVALSAHVFPSIFIFFKVLAYMCIGIMGSWLYRVKKFIVTVWRTCCGKNQYNIAYLRRGTPVSIPVDRYSIHDVDFDLIHNYYVKNSIPVILETRGTEMKSLLNNYIRAVHKPKLHYNQRVHQMTKPLRTTIEKVIGKWHVGTILRDGRDPKNQRRPHMSTTFDYEMDWVYRGSKQVTIVPKEFNQLLPIALYGDQFIENSKMTSESIDEWKRYIPYYYSTKVREGEILLYDNTNCLHQYSGVEYQSASFNFINFQSSSYALDLLRLGSSIGQTNNFRLLPGHP